MGGQGEGGRDGQDLNPNLSDSTVQALRLLPVPWVHRLTPMLILVTCRALIAYQSIVIYALLELYNFPLTKTEWI